MNWQEGGEVIFLFVDVRGSCLFVTEAPPRSSVPGSFLPSQALDIQPTWGCSPPQPGAQKQEKPN